MYAKLGTPRMPTLDLSAVRLHFHQLGDTRSPTLVLIHGGGIDAAHLSWGGLLEPLARAYRVIAPDLPGYGESTAPRGFTHTVAAYAQVVLSLMDALDVPQAHLAGISLGGAVTLHLALHHPERVARATLIASYGLQDRAPMHAISYVLTRLPGAIGLSYRLLRTSRALVHLSLQRLFADPRKVTEALVDAALAELRRPQAGQAFAAFQRHELLPGRLRTSYLAQLSTLRLPACFVHGDRDPLVPLRWAQAAQRATSHAALHVLSPCGHWVTRECPEQVLLILLEGVRTNGKLGAAHL